MVILSGGALLDPEQASELTLGALSMPHRRQSLGYPEIVLKEQVCLVGGDRGFECVLPGGLTENRLCRFRITGILEQF